MKKQLIYIGAFLFLLGVGYVSGTRLRTSMQLAEVEPTQSPIIVEVPLDGTGAILSSPSAEERRITDLVSQLRDQMPIEQEAFSVIFGLRTRVFEVTLHREMQESKSIFKDWLKEHQFSEIPESYFEYVLL
ncbi:MAG: hypothetical protein UX04_C0004G0048 [Microgenomates group bacterium GW2011_GWF2_45_18]|nr:MAG: hypothetical protein UW18_C0004G0048 [Microgenomates group bacterium GW2011_GWF1_44_10]KKU01704.1 MAG: hypothetical protein UX04_C0004G0048 [Microgenomates group bacterium GW2011_GWF2_45_18]OGJ41372.1 MAG: hypothetical protein A2378_03305 [Candidatus Pacebacteria bacterium RIFOXYB1_FULL_44_10]HAU99559.1 hypothetical protein [Candidatus Paceibacterota bacterium]HAX01483.1 hypothetical protein [Candidatus Paceibacterota bacterium]